MNQNMNGLLMDGTNVIEQPLNFDGFSQKLINYSVNFIETHKDRPFLLFHSFGHVHTPMFTAKHMKGISKHGRLVA